MWPYTSEENTWLESGAATPAPDAPIRYESPTPEMIRHYVREGERLRAEAIGHFWKRSFAALGRGFAALRDAVLIDTIHPGRHA